MPVVTYPCMLSPWIFADGKGGEVTWIGLAIDWITTWIYCMITT